MTMFKLRWELGQNIHSWRNELISDACWLCNGKVIRIGILYSKIFTCEFLKLKKSQEKYSWGQTTPCTLTKWFLINNSTTMIFYLLFPSYICKQYLENHAMALFCPISCRKFISRKQYSSLKKAKIIASTSPLMQNFLKIDQLVVFINIYISVYC